MIFGLKNKLLTAWLAVWAAVSSAAAGDLAAIRLGGPQAGVSRLVVEASEKPEYAILRAADGSNRLIVLLPGAKGALLTPSGRAALVAAVALAAAALSLAAFRLDGAKSSVEYRQWRRGSLLR